MIFEISGIYLDKIKICLKIFYVNLYYITNIYMPRFSIFINL